MRTRAGLFLLLCLLYPIAEALCADVYIQVDENGIYHFTDTPMESGYRLFSRDLGRGGNSATPYEREIRMAAISHGVDPDLVKAVIQVESGFDPRAVSRKGAKGLMQLMPPTMASLGGGNPFDPKANIRAGVRYLKKMLDRFGETEKALAAYNAGPTAVTRHDGVPPYPETRKYVQRVMAFWKRFQGGG